MLVNIAPWDYDEFRHSLSGSVILNKWPDPYRYEDMMEGLHRFHSELSLRNVSHFMPVWVTRFVYNTKYPYRYPDCHDPRSNKILALFGWNNRRVALISSPLLGMCPHLEESVDRQAPTLSRGLTAWLDPGGLSVVCHTCRWHEMCDFLGVVPSWGLFENFANMR